MGRLFWKFFLFIWLGQMAAVLGTGAFFWFERQQFEARIAGEEHLPPPHSHESRPPRPGFSGPTDHLLTRPPPRKHAGGPIPLLPVIAGLVASLLCAAGLAWYFAKPIRHLRAAFTSVQEGNLAVRVGDSMGGRRDELADLGHDFDRMTERLQALMGAQKRLLHDVSHEMRSPLARLQAAIGLLRQQPERLDDSLVRIEREGERMNGLVSELLTLSRLEAGVSVPFEDVEMTELLAGIVDDARFEGAERQVRIDFVADVVDLVVRANPELLHRAIENVIRNALRFSPVGGAVRLQVERQGNSVLLQIADEGIGVAASELEAIFVPFYRGREQASGSGYGLGLAIARQVIAAVDGEICAKLKADGQSGLQIDIRLPCK